MPDLIEQLQQYAAAAAEIVPPVDLGRVQQRTRRRRPRVLVAAAAIVVVMVTVGASLAYLSRGESPVKVTTDPPPQEQPAVSSSTTVDQTTTTGPATRTLRTSPVVAFTGSEYLVWSGEAGANDISQRADGFAVDVGTGAVRPIPVAPIDPRSGATGVWTGSELIVCCGTGQNDGYRVDTRSAAAWDPETGVWRTLATPPNAVARSYPTSIWTGELMVVVAPGPAAATYDPATDRWAEINPPSIGGRRPESVWTGEQMIVWDSRFGSGSPGADDIADRGWTWTPGADAWNPLPALPSGQRIELGSIAWTDSDLMVWGQSTSDAALGIGALWRPGTNEWRPVSNSPQGPVSDPYNGTPGSQALASNADGRVVLKGLDGNLTGANALYLFDPNTNTWTTTRLTIDGYHPHITFVDGTVLVPDSGSPIVGDLTP